MPLSSTLAMSPGVYFGTGDGIESGPLVARIGLSTLPNGGVTIDYEATSVGQGVQHLERTMLVTGRMVGTGCTSRTLSCRSSPSSSRPRLNRPGLNNASPWVRTPWRW